MDETARMAQKFRSRDLFRAQRVNTVSDRVGILGIHLSAGCPFPPGITENNCVFLLVITDYEPHMGTAAD